MAKKVYDLPIDKTIPWDGNEQTGGLPVAGTRIEEFIKNELNTKFGYLNMRFNDSESMYYIECFTSEDDYKQYESDKEAYRDLLLQSVQIPISTVEGDSFSVSMKTSLKNDANIVITDDNFEVPLNYRSIKISQIGNENANYAGTLIVESSTDGSTWNQMGTIPNVLISKDLTDTDTYQNVAIGQFLTQGRQQVRLRATYNYTNDEGVVKTVTSGNVMVGASVTKTSLRLELTTEYHQPMNAKDVNGNVQDFNVTYRVFGSAQKTLFLKIDGGTELKYDFDASVDSVNKTVSASGASYLTHGVHKVEAWLECQDGLGKTITSEKLVNRFMMVNSETPNADLNKPYLLLQNVDGMIGNFVQTEVCEYAVYSNKTDKVDVAFLLTTYTTDYETNKPSEYFRLEASVEPNTPNSLLTTVEIEAENDAQSQPTYNTYFRVRRISGSTNTDFMKESTNETSYLVIVDNTNAMTPVSGATFLMNPKTRNNNEANPLRILNAKNNNAEVESVWTNADLINGTWMTDDKGNKVLRIMAGTTLEIKKNVWSQFRTNPNSSLTFEIDCKISNVTNTTDPIIQMFSGTASSFRGLKMNALEGWLRNGTEQSADDTLFAWQEDVRTHFSFNINHQVFPNKGDVKYAAEDATKANGSIALARVLVNGDCVRELKFDTTKTDEWSSSDEGSIIIGNEGADIDIYSIRMYEGKQLDTIEILTRNFLATLPKADDKVALKEKNDLLDGGLISLEKSKNAKLNCMIWHGILPYKNNSSEQNGWVELWRYDNDGNYLADLSGTICKQTKSLQGKGQGSTAKTYYDWNLQEDSSKVTATIQVAVRDFHESISVRIDGDKAYIKGGNLGKNFPLDETEVAYPYSNGMVTVPDGWIDGNGKYRGMGYMVAYGTALAQKRVIKINYASSMQSHLLGACKTYDLLHRKVVGDTPLQERIPSAVAAKHTEPFMFFNQEEGGHTYFKGMGTYGAGKADKVAWGFVKKEMPMYALIEGSDNNLPMTEFRVPFDKNTAVWSTKGEGWLYDGQQSWDFDLGNTTDSYSDGWTNDGTTNDDGEIEMPSTLIRDKWADIHNFIYLHTTNLKFFDGTFEQFKQSEAAKDTNYKYWCTQGDQAFYLKRYDFVGKQWVNAGLYSGSSYRNITLTTNILTKAAYEYWVSQGTGDYSNLNNAFNNSLATHMRKYLKYFINEKSLQFNYCYVLGFLAGTDNSAKNTYYKIDPVGVKMEDEDNFGSWFLSAFRKDFDFQNVHQLYFDGDDMDSILRTDNNSHLTKPYYIDRLHPYADEKPNDSLYEGMGNQLFNFVEKAYEGTNELASVMNQIMIAATELIDENDTKDNRLVGGKSLWGFLNKYYFNTQRYFPQIAYLEQARIRYEFPELLGYISSGGGARSIRPITQSLGSQLQAELQYMNQRVIYMTSYAGFGAWGGDSTHSIGLADANETFGFMPANMPDGSGSTYTFTITPHQYIYPSYYLGQTFTQTHKRTSPKQTCTFTIAENLKDGGDTGIGICGINYISSLGNFGNKSIANELLVNGNRITGFNSNSDFSRQGFRPSRIVFSARNITNIRLRAYKNLGYLDLSQLTRLSSLQTVNVSIDKILCPMSYRLKEISIANTVKNLIINEAPNLSEITTNSTFSSNLITLEVGSNVGTKKGLSWQTVVENVYSRQKSQTNCNLQSIHVENINWTDFDVEALSWFADRPTCELKGTISIKETDEYRPAVTWDLKNKFLAKFGVVDLKNDIGYRGLLLDYKKRDVTVDGLKIKGNFYVEAGNTFQFELIPSSVYENTQLLIQFKAVNPVGYRITESGLLTVTNLPDTETFGTIQAVIYIIEGTKSVKHVISKTIEIWNRPAQVGDLVFADGTFLPAEQYDGEKTIVGRCCYVAPRKADGSINEKFHNPADKMTRLMMSCDNIKASSDTDDFSSWQWGAYYSDISPNTSIFETLENGGKRGLSINGGVTTIYDVPNLRNLATNNLTLPSGAPTIYITEESFRDYSDLGLENDGFKPHAAGYSIGDGFAYNESNTYLNERKIDDVLLSLAGSGYVEGDIVNSGYAKTLRVIAHRNNILRTGLSQVGLVPDSRHFHIPSGDNELYELAKCISSIREWAKSEEGLGDTEYGIRWSQIYYPLASVCYAYEPDNLMDGEFLNAKFEKHNWFAPTLGLLARICYYTYDYSSGSSSIREDSPLDTIKDSIGKTIFNRIGTNNYWTSTEMDENLSWYIYFSNGIVLSNTYKRMNCVTRAICAF